MYYLCVRDVTNLWIFRNTQVFWLYFRSKKVKMALLSKSRLDKSHKVLYNLVIFTTCPLRRI